MDGTVIFDELESVVRSYCRDFPAVFQKAAGHTLIDVDGATYLDFLSGAGALNYGHNNRQLRSKIISYMITDGITHSLDLHTEAKREFMQELQDGILSPRGLGYKMQFTGPKGTNAVEAALKLARRVTSRTNILAFTNSFHGMTLGALAVSGARRKRSGAGVPYAAVDRVPFDGYLGSNADSLEYIETLLDDPGSGIDPPAAFIVETLQAEGGLNEASVDWLQRLQALARKQGALLIVDEIQTGCGRTGPFFSFERANLKPDIICLAKSISGFGLPMAMLLIRPEVDVWEPGQHNGTFRGNNLAFVAGAEALRFWRNPDFEAGVHRNGALIRSRLSEIAVQAGDAEVRGKGMLQGLAWPNDPSMAKGAAERAYRAGVIVELCGARDEVLKVMPPLTITEAALSDGLSRIAEAVTGELSRRQLSPAA